MIDKAGAVPSIVTRVKQLPIGSSLDLLTFKRDRSVVIFHAEEDRYLITEKGFERHTFETDIKGLRKLLKTLLKREFPRSNKIRVREVLTGQ
ncbi:hypothetical protein [Pseudodesulfovibrio piezophilus]|uniref:Uncharacterized protein n=1 Tax=Pseudodesulfovibrio piezophilus (strain DSM 21447 / JCM 15486 / C1TLV30) TaxID=1322246 RepID=M1WM15_PSEP2|nr:hypothetical protein [Pseudodesulfovibrio piezophilus]CCH48820.1 conserved protein of unknown function [Pseudodesulfovibrio piezophilus C1TLV30]